MTEQQRYNDFVNLVELHLCALGKRDNYNSSLAQAEEKRLRKAVSTAISSYRLMGVKLMTVKNKKHNRHFSPAANWLGA